MIDRSVALTERAIAKFQSQYRIVPSGCWEWSGPFDRYGYGKFQIGNYGRTSAHRFSWRLHRGPVPHGAKVLHRCDNPACVNPGCLFIGTQAENLADMRIKGRWDKSKVSGESGGRARLTWEKVREIRSNPEIVAREFATAFGVGIQTVYHVRHGETWRE